MLPNFRTAQEKKNFAEVLYNIFMGQEAINKYVNASEKEHEKHRAMYIAELESHFKTEEDSPADGVMDLTEKCDSILESLKNIISGNLKDEAFEKNWNDLDAMLETANNNNNPFKPVNDYLDKYGMKKLSNPIIKLHMQMAQAISSSVNYSLFSMYPVDTEIEKKYDKILQDSQKVIDEASDELAEFSVESNIKIDSIYGAYDSRKYFLDITKGEIKKILEESHGISPENTQKITDYLIADDRQIKARKELNEIEPMMDPTIVEKLQTAAQVANDYIAMSRKPIPSDEAETTIKRMDNRIEHQDIVVSSITKSVDGIRKEIWNEEQINNYCADIDARAKLEASLQTFRDISQKTQLNQMLQDIKDGKDPETISPLDREVLTAYETAKDDIRDAIKKAGQIDIRELDNYFESLELPQRNINVCNAICNDQDGLIQKELKYIRKDMEEKESANPKLKTYVNEVRKLNEAKIKLQQLTEQRDRYKDQVSQTNEIIKMREKKKSDYDDLARETMRTFGIGNSYSQTDKTPALENSENLINIVKQKQQELMPKYTKLVAEDKEARADFEAAKDGMKKVPVPVSLKKSLGQKLVDANKQSESLRNLSKYVKKADAVTTAIQNSALAHSGKLYEPKIKIETQRRKAIADTLRGYMQTNLSEGDVKKNSRAYNDLCKNLKEVADAFDVNSKLSNKERADKIADLRIAAEKYLGAKGKQWRPFPSAQRISRLQGAENVLKFCNDLEQTVKYANDIDIAKCEQYMQSTTPISEAKRKMQSAVEKKANNIRQAAEKNKANAVQDKKNTVASKTEAQMSQTTAENKTKTKQTEVKEAPAKQKNKVSEKKPEPIKQTEPEEVDYEDATPEEREYWRIARQIEAKDTSRDALSTEEMDWQIMDFRREINGGRVPRRVRPKKSEMKISEPSELAQEAEADTAPKSVAVQQGTAEKPKIGEEKKNDVVNPGGDEEALEPSTSVKPVENQMTVDTIEPAKTSVPQEAPKTLEKEREIQAKVEQAKAEQAKSAEENEARQRETEVKEAPAKQENMVSENKPEPKMEAAKEDYQSESLEISERSELAQEAEADTAPKSVAVQQGTAEKPKIGEEKKNDVVNPSGDEEALEPSTSVKPVEDQKTVDTIEPAKTSVPQEAPKTLEKERKIQAKVEQAKAEQAKSAEENEDRQRETLTKQQEQDALNLVVGWIANGERWKVSNFSMQWFYDEYLSEVRSGLEKIESGILKKHEEEKRPATKEEAEQLRNIRKELDKIDKKLNPAKMASAQTSLTKEKKDERDAKIILKKVFQTHQIPSEDEPWIDSHTEVMQRVAQTEKEKFDKKYTGDRSLADFVNPMTFFDLVLDKCKELADARNKASELQAEQNSVTSVKEAPKSVEQPNPAPVRPPMTQEEFDTAKKYILEIYSSGEIPPEQEAWIGDHIEITQYVTKKYKNTLDKKYTGAERNEKFNQGMYVLDCILDKCKELADARDMRIASELVHRIHVEGEEVAAHEDRWIGAHADVMERAEKELFAQKQETATVSAPQNEETETVTAPQNEETETVTAPQKPIENAKPTVERTPEEIEADREKAISYVYSDIKYEKTGHLDAKEINADIWRSEHKELMESVRDEAQRRYDEDVRRMAEQEKNPVVKEQPAEKVEEKPEKVQTDRERAFDLVYEDIKAEAENREHGRSMEESEWRHAHKDLMESVREEAQKKFDADVREAREKPERDRIDREASARMKRVNRGKDIAYQYFIKHTFPPEDQKWAKENPDAMCDGMELLKADFLADKKKPYNATVQKFIQVLDHSIENFYATAIDKNDPVAFAEARHSFLERDDRDKATMAAKNVMMAGKQTPEEEKFTAENPEAVRNALILEKHKYTLTHDNKPHDRKYYWLVHNADLYIEKTNKLVQEKTKQNAQNKTANKPTNAGPKII